MATPTTTHPTHAEMDLLCEVVRQVARSRRLPPEDADDFVQTVHLPSLGVPLPMGWPQTVNHGLALTADGRLLLAAGSMKDFVAIYQVSDMSLLATIPVGKDPNWIVFSPDERFAYVSNRGEHTVSVISMADRKEIARLKAGKLPMRMTTATVSSPRTSSR